MEFILSDATPDRLGDIVQQNWSLDNYKKNPVALFNHRADFIVGTWSNLGVNNGELRGKLKLAPAGTSERIDEIRKLVEAGILKAVSVGFKPIEAKLRVANDPFGGQIYLKSELVETSLVSVPANPNALAVAKSLDISASTIGLVFAEQGKRNTKVKRGRGSTAEQGAIPPDRKVRKMSALTQRIEDAQKRLVAYRDKLTEHLNSVDDTNVTDEQMVMTQDLNDKIAATQKQYDLYVESEKNIAITSEDNRSNGHGGNGSGNGQTMQRPFAVPAMKIAPRDYVWRSLVCKLKSHILKRPPLEIMKETYGEDEATRLVYNVVTRTATIPADTTTSGWASQLVDTSIQDFFAALLPTSVYPSLSAKGGRFTFGRAGIISMPTRASTPTIAGSFVAQGAPIPVRQGAFTAVTLTPKKMGVISTFTREIAEHSTPAIEGLIRQAIVEDTGVAIDSVLLDATVASAIRPAGLKAGVAALTATAGGGLAALIGDIRALTGALITGTNGNLRSPVWLMNPTDVLAASMTSAVAGGGEFPFKEELTGGSLLGYPVIASSNVTADTMLLVDAADFISVTGDEPRFDVSDQAVLHMEDTTPLQISTGVQGSGVLATPSRSLWQTDTIGIRMLLDMNWALRRTGVVAWT